MLMPFLLSQLQLLLHQFSLLSELSSVTVLATLQFRLNDSFEEDEKKVNGQVNNHDSNCGVSEPELGLLAQYERRIAKDRIHG